MVEGSLLSVTEIIAWGRTGVGPNDDRERFAHAHIRVCGGKVSNVSISVIPVLLSNKQHFFGCPIFNNYEKITGRYAMNTCYLVNKILFKIVLCSYIFTHRSLTIRVYAICIVARVVNPHIQQTE